jgi:hypothetical protein
METIVIALLAKWMGGEALGVILGGMTGTEWLTLAAGIAENAAPAVMAQLKSKHPSLGALVESLEKGLGEKVAADAAQAWFKANQPETIPGYGPDGSVIPIHNPDAV